MGLKILALGEIVGKPGIFCIKNGLKKIKEEFDIDFVIANGEGTTGGYGIGRNHSIQIHKLGIDVITTGEKVFFKKDMVGHIGNSPYILRPANYPPGTPGRGWRVYQAGDKNIGVISLLGQSGFNRIHLSNPFTFIPDIIKRLKDETDIIVLDFHASTTAEKYSMFFHVDGSLNAVIGTHTKALTSDAAVFPNGTGVICDTGRTGSSTGVGGLAPDIEIEQFLTQIPERSKEWWNDLEIQGAVITISDDNKTESIKEIRYPITGVPDDRNG
jgi:2',3'-cyclic-nucleotide 2'-phosphodiesterase